MKIALKKIDFFLPEKVTFSEDVRSDNDMYCYIYFSGNSFGHLRRLLECIPFLPDSDQSG